MKKLFVLVKYNSINSVEKISEYFVLSEAGSCTPISRDEFLDLFENRDMTNLSGVNCSELPILHRQELPLYDCHSVEDYPQVFYYSKEGEDFTPPSLFTFFTEYPMLAQHLKDRDYLSVAKLLARSENLLENILLTKYVLNDSAFSALFYYWMAEFNIDKDEELSFLIQAYSGDTKINLSAISYHSQPYARLLKYAQGSFDILDFNDFRKLAREKLRDILNAENLLTVLPVTGTDFSSGLQTIVNTIHTVQVESLKQQATTGIDENKTRRLIKQHIDGYEFALLPEPNNPHDPNAVAVIFKTNDGVNRKLGYIKREFASVISPLMQKGLKLKTNLFMLTDSSVYMTVGKA